MSHEKPHQWPLPPSQSASVTEYLCMAMKDVVEHEAGSRMSRRTYLKLYGLAMAAEVFSRDAARWYTNLSGEDHDLLEGLEERYMARGAPPEKGG